MSESPQRVAVIECHPVLRERLAELIAAEPGLELVGEADDLQGGVALLVSARPELALVGLALRKSSGTDLIKQARALSLPTALLVYSGHDEALYARRVLADGAKGFISKDCTSGELLAAMRQVLSGKIYLSPAMTETMLHTLTASRIAAPVARSVAQLSDRELEVLEKIGEGKNTKEIATSLGLGLASVDTYRARIKEKLNLRNAFDLVCFAIRRQYDLN
ncbi:MAG: LuxR C-terminal-related transcriptional regulator [Chthoniobacteraceae bacterium]